MPWSFIKFSQLIHEGNVWRSVWRICMLILKLKGLNKEPGPREWTSLICTPPRRAPLLVPLSSLRWGDMGLPSHPPPPFETDQDSCPGWLPPVPLDLDFPQDGFSPGSLTPRLECFPATKIWPITFLWCFLFGILYRAMQNHPLISTVY